RAGPGDHAAPALRLRPFGEVQPGQGHPLAAPVWRQARALPPAPLRGHGRSVARVTPGSIDEAQSLLAQGGRSVLFVGGGTARPRGPPAELEISTAKLDRVVESPPADQVVTAESGVTLAELQAELAKHGQRLAIDPPQPSQATLGGIVASNSFGPLRTRY